MHGFYDIIYYGETSNNRYSKMWTTTTDEFHAKDNKSV